MRNTGKPTVPAEFVLVAMIVLAVACASCVLSRLGMGG